MANGASIKVADRREAKTELVELFKRAETVNVIHYSCERFYKREDGTSPRITSIAVRNLKNAQTISFSIHQIAERKHIAFKDIEANYDDLERQMLDEFYALVERRDGYQWLHWNMRDSGYGFQAIAHRHRVLGGTPVQIPENSLHDLARILVAIHGARYAPHPRMVNVMRLNHITDMDFLEGEQEAVAFENKEYVKLHLSTLRKVDVLAAIAQRELSGDLKTKARLRDKYGMNLTAWAEAIADHWVVKLFGVIAIAATLIGLILTIISLVR